MRASTILLSVGLMALSTASVAQNRSALVQTPQRVRGAALGHVSPLLPTRRGALPPNDECASAEPITIVGLNECETGSVVGDNGLSSTSTDVPTCDASDDGVQDVWYAFNSGTESVVAITLTPGVGMSDHGFAVYEGCAGTEVACEILPDGASITVVVTPGTDYVVQVYSNLDFGVGGEFTLCVAADDAVAPVNDLCSSATPEALAVGGSLTFNGTTEGATIAGDFAQEGNEAAAVWHAFTISTCATVVVDLCGTEPAFTNGYGIIAPSCPLDTADAIFFTSANTEACGDENFTITYLNVPAGTYYIPVWSEIGVAYGEYTLNVSALECTALPTNDDCANAISLTPGSLCTPVEGTTLLATQSQAPDTCSDFIGTADDDVWYSFVANNSTLTISVTGNETFDAVLGAFSGACGSLNLITCVDTSVAGEEEALELTDLNIGETYYYRLYSYADGFGDDQSFTTCVSGDLGTNIAGVDRNGAWAVYPNPSNGQLNIACNTASGRGTVEVLDLSGRLVHSELVNLSNGQRVALNLNANLAKGAYNVRLTNNTGSSTQRVVVE